ncbi:MAG: hypothetical protein ABFD89_22150 [Bryobacteraceae bacterium]
MEKRDPRVEPKPGDIHAGPVVKLRVDRAMYGIGGSLLYVECSICHRSKDDFSGDRKFTPAQFAQFVAGDKVEVLHVAD